MLQKRWFLYFVYHHPLGYPLLLLFRARFFSRIMGWVFHTSLSKYFIRPLVKFFAISFDSYDVPVGWFQTLNDFFIRRTRSHFRAFPSQSSELGSPSDGCFEIFQNATLLRTMNVKGYEAKLGDIFWPESALFEWGDLLFCRLRFSDYHRFHFFDDGEIVSSVSRLWPLYSVNNSVLDTGLWIQNKSHCMNIQTQNFGEVLWVEVGATNVGSIIQNKKMWDTFLRGDEKWYFALGGSAVLILFQKNLIQWSDTLLQKSLQCEEMEVMAGEAIWMRM